MFPKILIANRGEIAVRIMQSCRLLGVKTVAVYSAADADALHVRSADEAHFIGEAPNAESYLRGDKLIEVALACGAAAIHPGYGFLAENATFAEAVRAAGLVFIGPSAEAIRQMGSKTAAREMMAAADVPLVPGFQGDLAEFPDQAEQIGYPVLIKAAAGGGGKGMRVVNAPDELPDAIESAAREALQAFGDGALFMEKYLSPSHHVEFQIFGDEQGNIVHLFERECSIQRRHQKIIEETPSPLLDDTLRAEMGAAAVAAGAAVNYSNAGTVEFILDEAGNFYFLEMNTRLQVEHPITEALTGLDLVALQLEIAAGESLPFNQTELESLRRGHAIECRIYAEDPYNDFLPSIGQIKLAQFPDLAGVRVDRGVSSGDQITPYYDPMIAKIISTGASRGEAIARMQAALADCIILGLTTNIPFLAAVLAHEAFGRGHTPTDFINRYIGQPSPPAWEGEALNLALIAAALAENGARLTLNDPQNGASDTDRFSPWARSDGFRLGSGA